MVLKVSSRSAKKLSGSYVKSGKHNGLNLYKKGDMKLFYFFKEDDEEDEDEDEDQSFEEEYLKEGWVFSEHFDPDSWIAWDPDGYGNEPSSGNDWVIRTSSGISYGNEINILGQDKAATIIQKNIRGLKPRRQFEAHKKYKPGGAGFKQAQASFEHVLTTTPWQDYIKSKISLK